MVIAPPTSIWLCHWEIEGSEPFHHRETAAKKTRRAKVDIRATEK